MATKEKSLIITYIKNGIQKVIFNRPDKKNALTSQMFKDLIKILDESANNDDVTLLVMTGNGDFFSSGNDFISCITNEFFCIKEEIDIIRQFVESLILYPKLLIAVVNGPAIGISATTLSLFDIVYASDRTYFQTPFCKLGLSPEGCSTYTFSRIMGPSKSGEMLYFGEKLSAKEALQIGFVSKVFKSDAINEIWAHLEKISSLSKESLASTKKLLSRWNKNLLIEVNKQELLELENIYNSSNFISHISKFFSKGSKI